MSWWAWALIGWVAVIVAFLLWIHRAAAIRDQTEPPARTAVVTGQGVLWNVPPASDDPPANFPGRPYRCVFCGGWISFRDQAWRGGDWSAFCVSPFVSTALPWLPTATLSGVQHCPPVGAVWGPTDA